MAGDQPAEQAEVGAAPSVGNSASSNTALVRNGTIEFSVAAVMTAMATSTSLARYGRSSAAMRPSTGWSAASAISSALRCVTTGPPGRAIRRRSL